MIPPHWVAIRRRSQSPRCDPLGQRGHALKCEVRLYETLFNKPDPDEFAEGGSYLDNLNPNSLTIVTGLIGTSSSNGQGRRLVPIRARWVLLC